jgi:CubicO group peptidase (beta-lactamase class C family)
MNRTRKILTIGAGALVVTALAIVQIFGARLFVDPSATYRRHVYSAGHKALFMCSAVFIAGRKPEDIKRWELAYASPLFNAPGDAQVEAESKSAVGTAARGFIKRRAVYREGGGCTLLAPGAAATDLPPALAKAHAGRSRPASDAPWPEGDATNGAPPAGIDAAKLDAVMNAAFDGHTYYDPKDSWMPDAKTIGVVIVYQGKIIAERYADGWNAHTQYRTYSAAKSFTNLMAGSRVLEGKLDIDAPVLFPQWSAPNDPRRAITTRHLLNMSSGLDCDVGGSTSLETYFAGGHDAAVDVATRRLLEKPGTHWCYSNYDSISVALSVGRTFERAQDFLGYPYRVMSRIGIHDTYIETDPYGNFIMSSQIWTTPRDLARFGLLYLNDGMWNGERLLPEGWVAFTREVAPATRSMPQPPGYGAQFWLYNDHPRLPVDTFTAAGHGGQFSTIVPSRETVVVRMGLQNWQHKEFVADVLEALPPHGS